MKRSILVTIHLIFWVYFVLASLGRFWTFRYLPVRDVGQQLTFASYGYPVFVYLGYFLALWLIRLKKWMIWLAGGFVVLYVTGISFSIARNAAGAFILSATGSMLVGVVFSFVVAWYKEKRKADALQQAHLSSQLALLRSQVSPHFLFNTLNNIDSLIKTAPAKASDALVQLSGLMRYMIYDSAPEKVDLEREIRHLEAYIDLERLRSTGGKHIDFLYFGDPAGVHVAPMLFVPFVENAFKHSPAIDQQHPVTIRLDVRKDRIVFSSENPAELSPAEKDPTPGIGLETVKKRLDLLYPGKHELRIDRENGIFRVNLSLHLA